MTDLTDLIIQRARVLEHVHEPTRFDLKDEVSRKAFHTLLSDDPCIEICDQIHGQLAELIEIKNPSQKLSERDLEQLIKVHLDGVEEYDYGNWIYFPWNRKVVHLLPEHEFVTVRTNRNLYKITHEEQLTLSTKKVAVLGLSVGNSIAHTLAHERVCCELRLADFDELELSNLNRISSSVDEIGIEKTINTARHIAMMDPYLKVKIWREGATRENLKEILLEDKVDLVFDECDNLDIKVAVRQMAKEHGIAVMMDTSDAGMLDVERFDRDPERDIFHGLINHLDLEKVKDLKTSEEKVPYVLPILGIDQMSQELKTSMMEIGESISTWPQLASAVVGGAGIAVDVARRLLLDQMSESGRYYFDWSLEVEEEKPEVKDNTPRCNAPEMTTEYAKSIVDTVQCPLPQGAVKVPLEDLSDIIEAATLAPSGGNMQPWFWYYSEDLLYLVHDEAASFSMLDFQKRGSYLAFGAALENLRLKACQKGFGVRLQYPDNEHIAAVVSFHHDGVFDEPYPLDTGLIKGIGLRETNRNLEGREKLDKSVLQGLESSVGECKTHILEDTAIIDALGRAIANGDRIRLLNKWGHNDFINEMRWSDKEARETGTGVDLETVDLTEAEKAGLLVARDWSAIEGLKKLGDDKGTKFMELTVKTFESASALLLITGSDESLQTYMQAGHLLEQVWLRGNLNQLAIHPVSATLFLHYRAKNDHGTFSDSETWALAEVHDSVMEAFDLTTEIPLFLLRIGKAGRPKRSMRKPLSHVFHYATITNHQLQSK